ncbi:MAG: ASKHA domain-containing protein [Desulfonatronovibrio sp.]
MIKIQVTYRAESRAVPVDPSRNLAMNLFVQGFFKGVPLCGGLGNCGKCALIFSNSPPKPSPKDLEYFSPEKLQAGWRLGCSHYPAKNQEVKVPENEAAFDFVWSSSGKPVSLAIDIGTTSLKWAFVHNNFKISYGQTVNPQMGAGPDIMSRLSFARESPDNQNLLMNLLSRNLGTILDLGPVPDDRICVAGNPAMIHLLLGRDISGLSVSPYFLDYFGGSSEQLGRQIKKAFIPPLWSPFIGADISAGLFWILEKQKPDFPFLLADFGTNGELVLALSRDKYLATSIALGPALEGVGLRFGSPFQRGVASRFILDRQGVKTPDSWRTGKVSGSGYISLLALLLRLKLISVSGHFLPAQTPIARKIEEKIEAGRLNLTDGFYLEAHDIEEILKVKAAFTLALSFLCAQADLPVEKLQTIFIAGALGEHSNSSDLETLGFFPSGFSHKCQVLGNTSLKGAILLAADNSKRRKIVEQAQFIQPVNLSSNQEYISSRFAGHMAFEYPH